MPVCHLAEPDAPLAFLAYFEFFLSGTLINVSYIRLLCILSEKRIQTKLKRVTPEYVPNQRLHKFKRWLQESLANCKYREYFRSMEVIRSSFPSPTPENPDEERAQELARVFREARKVDEDVSHGILNGNADSKRQEVLRDMQTFLPNGAQAENILGSMVLLDGRVSNWRQAIATVYGRNYRRQRDIEASFLEAESSFASGDDDGGFIARPMPGLAIEGLAPNEGQLTAFVEANKDRTIRVASIRIDLSIYMQVYDKQTRERAFQADGGIASLLRDIDFHGQPGQAFYGEVDDCLMGVDSSLRAGGDYNVLVIRAFEGDIERRYGLVTNLLGLCELSLGPKLDNQFASDVETDEVSLRSA